MEVKDLIPPNFQPEATGTLKLGGLTSFKVNLVNDTRITVPIPEDHHTFEELDALRKEGLWKNVVLSSISVQLKTWTGPKVRTYSFLGRVIKTERGEAETLVTLDKYGEVTISDVDV